jgi:fatty acid desaturase
MRRTIEPPHGEEFRWKAQRGRGLTPDEVRALSRIDARRATLSLVETFGLIAAFVTVAVRWPHPAIVAAAIVGIAGGQHGLAVLVHEAAHYRLYSTRWLNDLVGRICAAPLSVSMLTYRVIHRIHHNHLYEPIDPDLALMAGYPRGRKYLLRKLAKDFFGLTTVKNYLYFVRKPPSGDGQRDDTSSELRSAAKRDRRIMAGLQYLFLGIAIATGVWRWYLLLWLLPAVTVLQVLLRLRGICEHGAPRSTASPLTAARTTLATPLLRWLVFPHDVQYHIEHHLYPSVPHYRLRDCHARLLALGALDDAEVSPGLLVTLRKLFADPAPGSR